MKRKLEEKQGSEQEAINLGDLEIEGLLGLFICLLSEKALRYLGVPKTEDNVRDLKRASVTINSISRIIDQLEVLVPGEMVDQYRSLLSELQLQYVRQTRSDQ